MAFPIFIPSNPFKSITQPSNKNNDVCSVTNSFVTFILFFKYILKLRIFVKFKIVKFMYKLKNVPNFNYLHNLKSIKPI